MHSPEKRDSWLLLSVPYIQHGFHLDKFWAWPKRAASVMPPFVWAVSHTESELPNEDFICICVALLAQTTHSKQFLLLRYLGFQGCGCMITPSNGAVCALLALQKEKENKNAGVPNLCQNLRDWWGGRFVCSGPVLFWISPLSPSLIYLFWF